MRDPRSLGDRVDTDVGQRLFQSELDSALHELGAHEFRVLFAAMSF